MNNNYQTVFDSGFFPRQIQYQTVFFDLVRGQTNHEPSPGIRKDSANIWEIHLFLPKNDGMGAQSQQEWAEKKTKQYLW